MKKSYRCKYIIIKEKNSRQCKNKIMSGIYCSIHKKKNIPHNHHTPGGICWNCESSCDKYENLCLFCLIEKN